MPAQINFPPITQGDTWSKSLLLQDQGNAPLNLTGCIAHMQFRSQYYGVIYADISTGQGGITINGPAGTLTLTLTADQTRALLMRNLIWDLDITWPDGQRNTIISGTVTVTFEVTIPNYALIFDFSDPDNSGGIALLLAGFLGLAYSEYSLDFTQTDNSGYIALFLI